LHKGTLAGVKAPEKRQQYDWPQENHAEQQRVTLYFPNLFLILLENARLFRIAAKLCNFSLAGVKNLI